MIGKCYDCKQIRLNTGLPSKWDSEWLNGPHPSLEWRCEPCYWEAYNRILSGYTRRLAPLHNRDVAEVMTGGVEVIVTKRYLMSIREVVPFLASLAVIIMVCLILAAHLT